MTMIALIFQFIKIQVYIRLIDEVAPLISIIYKIVDDIKPFTFVMTLVVILGSNSFWLLGKNQEYYDNVE